MFNKLNIIRLIFSFSFLYHIKAYYVRRKFYKKWNDKFLHLFMIIYMSAQNIIIIPKYYNKKQNREKRTTRAVNPKKAVKIHTVFIEFFMWIFLIFNFSQKIIRFRNNVNFFCCGVKKI